MKASGILNYIKALGGNMKDSKIRYGVYALLIGVTCTFHPNISPRINLKNEGFSDFIGAYCLSSKNSFYLSNKRYIYQNMINVIILYFCTLQLSYLDMHVSQKMIRILTSN